MASKNYKSALYNVKNLERQGSEKGWMNCNKQHMKVGKMKQGEVTIWWCFFLHFFFPFCCCFIFGFLLFFLFLALPPQTSPLLPDDWNKRTMKKKNNIKWRDVIWESNNCRSQHSFHLTWSSTPRNMWEKKINKIFFLISFFFCFFFGSFLSSMFLLESHMGLFFSLSFTWMTNWTTINLIGYLFIIVNKRFVVFRPN